jgi:hypothetical protein
LDEIEETKMQVQVLAFMNWITMTTQVMYTQLLFFPSLHTHTHTHTFYHSIILCACLEWSRVAHNTIDTPTPEALNMSVVLVDRYKGKKKFCKARETLELSVKSPSVSPPISSTFAPLSSSFSGICKVMKFY